MCVPCASNSRHKFSENIISPVVLIFHTTYFIMLFSGLNEENRMEGSILFTLLALLRTPYNQNCPVSKSSVSRISSKKATLHMWLCVRRNFHGEVTNPRVTCHNCNYFNNIVIRKCSTPSISSFTFHCFESNKLQLQSAFDPKPCYKDNKMQ